VTSKTLSLSDLTYLAAAIVAIGGAAVAVGRGAVRVYRRTIGSRRDLGRRLNQMGAGTTIRWVEDRFGTPAFSGVFASAETPGKPAAPAAPLRQLVYRERHVWLQVLVNENDAVVRFSITVTDPRFSFEVFSLTNYQMKARIGRSRFADIHGPAEPQGRSLRIGAHNREYAEAYWFGNPGNYQWFVLSHNDAGTGAFGFAIERDGPAHIREGVLQIGEPGVRLRPFDPAAGYATRFRAATVINTLTVLGPLLPSEGLAEPRGPDSNQVRVLLPGVRQRWKIRRRLRHWHRMAERESRRHLELQDPVEPG
jgi:hypothetical protein